MVRALAAILLAGLALGAETQATETDLPGDCTAWPYLQEWPLPAEFQPDGPKWYDFIVPPSVFDQARDDLGDLRLYDAAGAEIPYALRIRRPTNGRQEVAARQFNRAVSPDQSSELTLDLGDDPPEHNEVEVRAPGTNYRRAAELDGSNDGQTWRKLLAKNLVDFQADGKQLEDLRLIYPPSRFRYLRLRVHRDPAVDEKPVAIGQVVVRRTVEIPGEFVTLPAKLGPREAVRAGASPGSAWILDLGAAHQPCEKLLVEIADREFARDYGIEAGGMAGSDEPFQSIGSGQWSRRAGDPLKPLAAEFIEQHTGRLRLTVTDFRNPPLKLTSAEFVALTRQIVFERKSSWRGPLRLFYGNLAAEPPHYDLERNLPAQLDPPPERLTLLPRQTNPTYVSPPPQSNPAYIPPPRPLAERFPWAIYLVLGAAGGVLATILYSLGKTAAAMHDAASTSVPEPIGQAPRA